MGGYSSPRGVCSAGRTKRGKHRFRGRKIIIITGLWPAGPPPVLCHWFPPVFCHRSLSGVTGPSRPLSCVFGPPCLVSPVPPVLCRRPAPGTHYIGPRDLNYILAPPFEEGERCENHTHCLASPVRPPGSGTGSVRGAGTSGRSPGCRAVARSTCGPPSCSTPARGGAIRFSH